MACGRIRKKLGNGWTSLVDGELKNLKVGVLCLEKGKDFQIETQDREFACVLIKGQCEISLASGLTGTLGPRKNPFDEPPFGAVLTRDEKILIKSRNHALIGIASAPCAIKKKSEIILPEKVGGGSRGKGNWERSVRFVIWSDNTEGNMIMAGETCTPSGNWSTMPPHRHQFDIPEEEVPYEEAYFYQFSRPEGCGLAWQFDDEGSMDQAFSIKENDVLYMDKGYHPAVCCPGATLYHLTFMAGPNRISKSSVHEDFQILLDESKMENPYAKQETNKRNRKDK